jgi:hypothetical protein
MNDKFRDDTPAKPKAGVVKVHEGKGDYACPSAGVTPHPEKAVGHEKGTLSNPSAGATDRGKDRKNSARPSAGVANENKNKIKFDDEHKEHI